MIRFCFFMVIFSFFIYSESTVMDVEKVHFGRTKEYSRHPYDKIVIFSAPRTGSSIVYNYFRFLFEDSAYLTLNHHDIIDERCVLKTHKIQEIKALQNKPEHTLYVVTIRDPIQASLSFFRVETEPVTLPRMYCQKMMNMQLQYFQFLEKLQEEGYPVLVLKYEDFIQDPSRILCDQIESYFHFSILEQDRDLLKNGYSIENVRANISTLVNFNEFLPLSGFHGNHIAPSDWAAPASISYWMNFFYEKNKDKFQKYGY